MHSFIQLSLLFIKCYNSQPIDDPLSIESTNHSPFSVENTWSNSNSTLNTFNSSSLKYLNQSTLVTKIIGPPQNQTYTPEWPHVFDSINDLYHAIKHSNETVISSMFSSNYINRKFIGCGANGLVYSFFSISSKKQVAIKFSIGEPLDKELPHEVSVLEFISSISGVPKIYAFGRISGTTIVVMNLIRRQDNVPDFYAWNKIHTMEYFEMIEMFQQLVKIVTKLHSIGVVHCDIKEGVKFLLFGFIFLTLLEYLDRRL